MTIIRTSTAAVNNTLAFDADLDLVPVAGVISAADYDDLDDVVLDDCESTSGWTATGVADGGVVQLDSTNKTTGSNSIRAKTNIRQTGGSAGSLYKNFAAPQSIGDYVEIAFDWRFEGATGGDGRSVGGYYRAFVADGVDGTGNVVYTEPNGWVEPLAGADSPESVRRAETQNELARQAPFQNEWWTVRIPLRGLSSIRSVGVKQMVPGSTSGPRVWHNIDNVRLREATGLDRAVYSAEPGAHITIPPQYESEKEQLPIFQGADDIVWTDMRKGRARRRFDGGVYHADDFMLDATGERDEARNLMWIWKAEMPDGGRFEFRPAGHYQCNSEIELFDAHDLTIDGKEAVLFSEEDRDSPYISMIEGSSRLRFEHLNIVGYRQGSQAGNTLDTVAGTPGTSGTDRTLSTLDDEVKISTDDEGRELAYGRDKDGYYHWDVTAKDTAQVADDMEVTVYDQSGETVIHTETFTLTADFADYRVSCRPLDLYDAPQFRIKKATATTNTITVDQVKTYRTVFFEADLEGSSGFAFKDATNDVRITNCRVEAMRGDAVQNSASLATDVKISGLMSRCNCRQGMSFNFGKNITIEDFEIIFTGRSGIDIEPYDDFWFSEDVKISRGKIYRAGINGISAANWGRITRLTVEHVDIVASSSKAMIGGGNDSRIVNVRSFKDPYRVETAGTSGGFHIDFGFAGRNMFVDQIHAIRGINFGYDLQKLPHDAGFQYPGGYVLGSYKVSNPATGMGVSVEPGADLTLNCSTSAGSTIVPTTGRNDAHGPVGHVSGVKHGSGIYFPVNQNRLPASYPGLGFTSVWQPGGFDLLDESLTRVKGLGGGGSSQFTLLSSAARTTDGTGSAVDVGDASVVRLRFYLTAISGVEPRILLTVQQSHDASTWTTIDTFREIRNADAVVGWSEARELRNTARYLRCQWVITGGDASPSLTFGVTGDSLVVPNNFRGIEESVTTSATSHAVTFPSRSFPELSGITPTNQTTVGATLPLLSTFYYRIAARPIQGGPLAPTIAQSTRTLTGTQNSVRFELNGIENLASGVQIPGVTIYRGTVSGGPYTHRADLLPWTRFFSMPRSGQRILDMGDYIDVDYETVVSAPWTNGYPAEIPWRPGSFTPVNETGYELNATYMVHVEVSSPTPWHPAIYISNKARSGFTINFDTPAPVGAKVSWMLVR